MSIYIYIFIYKQRPQVGEYEVVQCGTFLEVIFIYYYYYFFFEGKLSLFSFLLQQSLHLY